MSHEKNSKINVSVLMAVHNGLPYVQQAISSVLDQTMQSIELIVINDGSTDGTGELLEKLSSYEKRLHILHNPVSLGLTRCLNLALVKAVGQYVARIDHDDLWLVEKLAKQIDYLDLHPEVGLLGTAYREEHINGCWSRTPILPLCQDDADIRSALYSFNPFLHSSILVRRNLLISHGGYNERYRYAQDYELWVRLLRHTQAATIPEVLCLRRLTDSNISVLKERSQRFNALRAKLYWAKHNGFSSRVFIPMLRDLVVVLAPLWLKSLVRSGMNVPTSK